MLNTLFVHRPTLNMALTAAFRHAPKWVYEGKGASERALRNAAATDTGNFGCLSLLSR